METSDSLWHRQKGAFVAVGLMAVVQTALTVGIVFLWNNTSKYEKYDPLRSSMPRPATSSGGR